MENLKKMAGIKAAEFVTDGMVVGLGTGSTAYYFVEEIGRRIKEEGLQITAVTTSSVTSKQAEGLNIPLKSIDQVDSVDVTVDGADEVDNQFNGIKGGGGALLMEKVVATPSKEYIWVVDESKLVDKLGAFKLPVEVVQYGAEQVFRRFERAGYKPSFREKDGHRFVTDMQNFIIDLALDVIEDPITFGQELDQVVGVVEHGLFNQMVDKVIVAGRDGIQILTSRKRKIEGDTLCQNLIVFIWVVLDSVGIGAAPDANNFVNAGVPDGASDTLGHISKTVGLNVPNMAKIGLGNIPRETPLKTVAAESNPTGYATKLEEVSLGKDTMTGHWEIMGLNITEPFDTFWNGFPEEILTKIEEFSGRKVIREANKPYSGTAVIDDFGPRQMELAN